MISEHLQAHLRYLNQREAPYPLADSQGNLAALHLFAQGLSYNTIAVVMREYHGIAITANAWRKRLREMGVEPRPLADGSQRVPSWVKP